jgi:hypothetical protein
MVPKNQSNRPKNLPLNPKTILSSINGKKERENLSRSQNSDRS